MLLNNCFAKRILRNPLHLSFIVLIKGNILVCCEGRQPLHMCPVSRYSPAVFSWNDVSAVLLWKIPGHFGYSLLLFRRLTLMV